MVRVAALALALGACTGPGDAWPEPNPKFAAVMAQQDSITELLRGRRDIAHAVQQYKGDLPWRLVVGVILTENPWLKADTVNSYGAVGLMQVVGWIWQGGFPDCPSDLQSVHGNVCYGTSILRRYLVRTNGNVPKALRKYSGNAEEYAERVWERGEIE
jgi:hypothetical protein